MMMLLNDIRDQLIAFAKDEDGSQSVEMMLMIPIYVWSFLATYVFFDAFRVQSINAKAGYTIGDYMSRQTAYITPDFIDSMHNLQQSIVDSRNTPRIRITTFVYHESTDRYFVCWSRVRGAGDQLTDARLATMRSALPDMTANEIGILVQTSVDYEPIFAAGIARMDFDDFVVTSPRVGQAKYNSVNYSAGTPDTSTEEACVLET